MNIYINENIKRLRKEKEITQETLADFLGISFQSVSKWERGESLPDITLVPAIANYFGVTIDELMGNDKIKNEEKIKYYLDEYEKIDWWTEEAKTVKPELAKQAYKEFPYDWRIINMYRASLISWTEGDNTKYEIIKPEVRRLCEMILDKCNIEEFRLKAIQSMINLSLCNSFEEAEEWLILLPNDLTLLQCENRLNCYISAKRYEEADLQRKKNLEQYYAWLMWVMLDMREPYNKTQPPESSYVIEMIKKQIAITNILFANEESKELPDLAWLKNSLAQEYFKIGDIENGFTHLDEAVKDCIKYDFKPPTPFLETLETENIYDCVRNDERFKKNIELLKQKK